MSKPRAIFRAQAVCQDCPWEGERRAGPTYNPVAQPAFDEAHEHERDTGHRVPVNRWWRFPCARCRISSPQYERARQAWNWWDQHQRTDPRHLRRQQTHAEHEELADRITRELT
jgi:hypothetical protein